MSSVNNWIKSITALAFCVGLISHASAAVVTLNESGIEAIFSQSGFGEDPIDIRYNAITTLLAPDLLELTVSNGPDDEFGDLAGPFNSSNQVIDMYFVDSILFGDTQNSIDGIANINTLAVRSDSAAGLNGAALQAHELSHLLGLRHCGDTFAYFGGCDFGDSALMQEAFPTDAPAPTSLNNVEIAQIFQSRLLQSDAQGFFLEINPILVLAELEDDMPVDEQDPSTGPVVEVPEPATWSLLLLGLLALVSSRRKRKANGSVWPIYS